MKVGTNFIIDIVGDIFYSEWILVLHPKCLTSLSQQSQLSVSQVWLVSVLVAVTSFDKPLGFTIRSDLFIAEKLPFASWQNLPCLSEHFLFVPDPYTYIFTLLKLNRQTVKTQTLLYLCVHITKASF